MTNADSLRVSVLDVGQGSGNFFEMLVGGQVAGTALIDLGSERAKHEAGTPAVEYIVEALEDMAKTKGRARLDFLALTHSDSDHINLILELLGHFDPPSVKSPQKWVLEIGHAVFGGPRVRFVKHQHENVLDAVARYQTKKNVEALPSNACSYYYKSTPLSSVMGVDFYLVVGNHVQGIARKLRKRISANEWKTNGFSLNTYSLVFDIHFADSNYVVTGDATGATINVANQFIEDLKVTFSNTVMLTMPHHGSLTTTFGMTSELKRKRPAGNRVPEKAKTNVETFANNIKARTIHASAEDHPTFKHPSAYVMSYFWTHVDSGKWWVDPDLTVPGHFYNAYFEAQDAHTIILAPKKPGRLPPFDDWWTYATNLAMFTNRYYVRDQTYDPAKDETALFPPGPASVIKIPTKTAKTKLAHAVIWVYRTEAATKETRVDPVPNRKALPAVEAQAPYFSMSHPSVVAAEEARPTETSEGRPSVRYDAAPAQDPVRPARRFTRATRLV